MLRVVPGRNMGQEIIRKRTHRRVMTICEVSKERAVQDAKTGMSLSTGDI